MWNGYNIEIGKNFYLNHNLIILYANNDCFGGNVVVLPEVRIGDNYVVGTGSVVTNYIPSNSIAVGNSCRVIKSID